MKNEFKHKKHFDSLLRAIDAKLDRYLPRPKAEYADTAKAMRYSVFSGGKRIRPLLTVEAALVCGGTLKEALPAACAVEFVHTYSLIHDDLPAMDDDDCRRGRPSCHKAFGEANAILAGDALLTLAFQVIADNMPPAACRIGASVLARAAGITGMVGGQAADMKFKNRKMDAEMLNRVHVLKTGKLFEASTALGAVAAGSASEKMQRMAEYGAALGMAFQIVDDILDGDGYSKVCGKVKAKRLASLLTARAKNFIKIFGKKSECLMDMADFVLERAQ